MLKRYNGFLVEKLTSQLSLLLEGQINASSDFVMKLKEISKGNDRAAELADKLLSTIDDEDYFDDDDIKQNYFSTTDKDDTVSFLLNNKVPDNWNNEEDASMPYNMKGRNEVKVGRIIRYLFELIEKENGDTGVGDVKDKDIEKFVNAYKASKVDTKIKFKLVKGEDIAEYYHEDKYFGNSGSLGGSCMKDEGSGFFEIYSQNKKKVNLLIYVDGDDKIHGRALVWKMSDSPCNAEYFMDRVYVNRDSDEIKFKKFAEDNGFLYKKYMNSHIENNVIFMYKGKEVCGEVRVKLDGDCDEYPFIDTLCFLSDKHLSNLPSEGCDFLHSVSGDCEKCNDCGGDLNTDGEDIGDMLKSSDFDVEELCHNCCEGHKKLHEKGIPTKYNGLKKK